MLYEHYLDIAADVDALIRLLQTHPDGNVREQVTQLLERLDLLHREGLVRLADALRSAGASDALQQATSDPVVRVLLGLYDLVDLGIADGSRPAAFMPLVQLRQDPAR
jgi:hypothetical protein